MDTSKLIAELKAEFEQERNDLQAQVYAAAGAIKAMDILQERLEKSNLEPIDSFIADESLTAYSG